MPSSRPVPKFKFLEPYRSAGIAENDTKPKCVEEFEWGGLKPIDLHGSVATCLRNRRCAVQHVAQLGIVPTDTGYDALSQMLDKINEDKTRFYMDRTAVFMENSQRTNLYRSLQWSAETIALEILLVALEMFFVKGDETVDLISSALSILESIRKMKR